MHAMSPITGISGPSPGGAALQGLHGMHHAIHGFQGFHGIPGMQGYPSMPGMASLIQPPGDAGQPTAHHHTSSTVPVTQHLVGSSGFAHSSLLNGGIDKRRKGRKRTGMYGSLLSSDDPHSMMMAAQHAVQAPSVPVAPSDSAALIHPGHHQHPQLPEADGVQFKYVEQLPDAKIKRLREEKIKPIEELTFDDIKAYNRNQLRAYCFVYGIKRKKKAEMEMNMARYAAMFHPNDPNYDMNKFETTKYIEGAIPRRRVPVTKEQKERAAGNPRRLTSALQHRPQNFASQYHHHPVSHHSSHSHQLGMPQPSVQPPPLPTHHALSQHLGATTTARLHDLNGHSHPNGHHPIPNGHAHHGDEQDVVAAASDIMSVPDSLHVPNNLLSISHQIEE